LSLVKLSGSRPGSIAELPMIRANGLESTVESC
jgi:hypothetical protein